MAMKIDAATRMLPDPPEYGRAVRERAISPAFPIYAAAALSLAAAMIHLWTLPEHLLTWWVYGAFFLVVAFLQGLYAMFALRWPTITLCLAGIGANLSIVALYVVSRTAGIPFGPNAGKIEQAGLLDMTAMVAELGLVFALVMMLDGVSRRRTINVLLLLGAVFWVLRLAGVLS